MGTKPANVLNMIANSKVERALAPILLEYQTKNLLKEILKQFLQ